MGITIGALCAGGTLGILIPPSIVMVIYAVAAEVSLVKLMIAGFLPGFLLMALFSLYIIGWSLVVRDGTPPADPPMPLGARLKVLLELGPMMGLLLFVFGALIAGWVTATECAAWSVLGSHIVPWHSNSLTWAVFYESLRATIRTSCMIIVLVAAAGFMSSFMALAGIPKAIAGQGLPDCSGSYSGFYDDATVQMYTAAQDGVARKFYRIPRPGRRASTGSARPCLTSRYRAVSVIPCRSAGTSTLPRR